KSLIIIDLFQTLTAQEFGTVFLPAISAFEKDGTFMNSERRIQRVRACVSPRGNARPDLWILTELAKRLGHSKGFAEIGNNPDQVWDEVRSLWPAVAGISYARIEKHGIQWPCPDENHPGTRFLHRDSFPIGDKAAFKPLQFYPSQEIESTEFPLLLNTGRTLAHFNAATMSGASRNHEIVADDFVEVHPSVADRASIGHLARVRITTRHGSFIGTAHVTDRVNPGELFAVFHRPDAYINHATGTGRDHYCDTPEYKVTAAKIERI
ncbi:MAG: molybdopterin dinucleotide binding domain-containing protein, partial [Bdellovibrionota bacterium]